MTEVLDVGQTISEKACWPGVTDVSIKLQSYSTFFKYPKTLSVFTTFSMIQKDGER